MTDKEERSAHEAQEATTSDFEQTTLFEQPATEAEAAETFASIAALLKDAEAIRESPDYKATDLVCKLQEIELMMQRDSSPRAIKVVCKSAATDAEALAISTGNPKFATIAERLRAIADYAHEAQEATNRPVIRIDLPPVDPKLDPNSPEFDFEAWKAELDKAGGFEGISQRMTDQMERLEKTILGTQFDYAEAFQVIGEELKGITDTIRTAFTGAISFIQSDTFAAIKESLAAVGELMVEHSEEIEAAADETTADSVKELIPFIKAELEAMKNDPQFAECTLKDIIKGGFDADGNPTESPFAQAIERAKAAKRKYEQAQEIVAEAETIKAELPRIMSHPIDKLTYPLDKPNSIIWNLIAGADPNGQIQLAIGTGKKGGGKEATVLYGINFDELETSLTITKKLTPFDKRCYIAVAGLYNGGNDIVSATQIYKMMGNSGQPKAEQIQKINDSLTKMGAARVFIDNQKEAQSTKYSRFKYDASLLPFERISAYINNTLTESAIHIFREPPLITFARQRNQISSITRQLLESPISKTDANLLIDDYLLERISHMKSGKGKAPRKMLFTTIYEHCGIKTAMQKQRAPEKIRRYLDHYKKCEWIRGYTEDKDGITIIL